MAGWRERLGNEPLINHGFFINVNVNKLASIDLFQVMCCLF